MPTKQEWLQAAKESDERLQKLKENAEDENYTYAEYLERKRDWQEGMANSTYDESEEPK